MVHRWRLLQAARNRENHFLEMVRKGEIGAGNPLVHGFHPLTVSIIAITFSGGVPA